MNQQELSNRLWDFAARVGKVIDSIPDTRLGRQVSGQLVRCGTSPAPNYDESGAAESRADFVHKLSIALKELRETRGWLRFIIKSELLDSERMDPLVDESEQLCRILGKSVLTLKDPTADSKNDRLKMKDSKFQDSRVIDLTLTLSPGMRGVEFEQAKTVEREGWNARTLHLYSHAGTHMDAQTHFAAGAGTIDVTPLERCMGWAWVINLDGLADQSLITVESLGAVAEKFVAGESLLLRTGWSQHVDNPQHYRDNFPRISDELAGWCVEKNVNVLGVEPPSIADVNDKVELTRIHKILLGANITVVEGLTHLDALTQEKVFFVAAPLKIEGGDGCPCRAFAIEGNGWPLIETKS